ncbi:MAG TPA: amino acid ABC transporter permease [Planctomycetota bacterium]|nr:amino acid ABC transporter permease [Planctomycetota bacterium]
MKALLVRLGVTAAVAGALVAALWQFDLDFSIPWRYRDLYVEGLGRTVAATGLAFGVGMVLGVAVALLRLSRRLAIRHLGDLYVELIRGTPFVVQVWIAYFGVATLLRVDNKFFVGTLALGVFAAAYMGEIFRAGIESVERGQVEAARSLGLSHVQTLRHVIFPQAFKRMIPPLTGELIALTKESSLLYLIGLVEMMAVAKQVGADTYRNFEAFLVVAAMYLTLTVPLSLFARRLERRLKRSERTGVHL